MKKYNSKGFTLVELLLVIAIIAILATVLFVSLGGQRERARNTAFKENVRGLVTTFTGCVDGKGTIANGEMNANLNACTNGTSGITAKVPAIPNCNGSGNVSITSSNGSADNWAFSSVCQRTGGNCTANCSADGCTFTGMCE